MRNSWEMNNISAIPCCITTEYLATMHGTMHYSMYTAHRWASLAMHAASSWVGTTDAGATARYKVMPWFDSNRSFSPFIALRKRIDIVPAILLWWTAH